ncbi:hypothetical protein [Candidatus Methylacidiphilum infernorum]|nr:hypothetical protein [Candidatus Methylacidiphilum infernorum]
MSEPGMGGYSRTLIRLRRRFSNGWQPQLLYPWQVRPVAAALRQGESLP